MFQNMWPENLDLKALWRKHGLNAVIRFQDWADTFRETFPDFED